MSLVAGTRLGPYEVISALGAGGMGEVYKARDTRLERTVALKVIHPAVASSPEIRERFDREAKAISALDHPHICTLYDVCRERVGGDEVSFLVMQYLDGETLADRLTRAARLKSDPAKPPSGDVSASATVTRGPLPLEMTLRYAAEIADALDAAHRRGIVHRDLKPGNVMITKAGTKLLDFGLAKLAADEAGAGVFGDSTRSQPLTSQGAILGTLHYMSPEQLEGRHIDSRSDIFSFGTLLYEMLTSRRPFESQSQAGIIAGIMGGEPPPLGDLADARTAVPVVARRALDRLLTKCLAKDRDERWQSAGDLADELRWINEERLRRVEEPASGSMPAAAGPVSRTRERTWMAVAAALLVALAGLAIWWYPRAQPPAEPVAFTIDPPEGSSLATGPALLAMSPDGRKIAFITGLGDASQLWVRPIGSLVAQRLDRTAGAWQPYWSPDSRTLAFSGAGGLPLRRIDASGGAPTTLVESVRERGAWGAGVVVFTGLDSRLYRVAETGGAATLLVDFDSTRQEVALTWPAFLPDGRRFVFLARSSDRAKSALFLASVDKPGRTHLVDAMSNVDYAAGHLFYMRDGTLYAHPFDERAGRITGEAFQVVESIRYNPANGRGAFSVSAGGVLAYVSGESTLNTTREILRFDRFGKPLGSIGAAGTFSGAWLSPDGRRIVAVEENRQEQKSILWLMDVDRGAPIRFTVGAGDEGVSVWAPDGKAVVFASIRPDVRGIFRRAAGGGATTDELLLASPDEPVVPTGFSSQGDVLLFTRGGGSRRRIWALPVPPLGAARDPSAKPTEVFPGSTTVDAGAVFSPDGKWIAYHSYTISSVETSQVFLQPYPADGRRILVSPTTGFNPQWTVDQKQIVYRTVDDALMAVTIPVENGTPKPGAPQTLFTQPRAARFNWSFSMNGPGDQFVLVVPPPKAQPEQQPAAPITVIVNWAQSLKRK